MKKYLRLFIPFIVLTAVVSCSQHNRFHIDTSKNRIEVKIHRFDKDLIHLNADKSGKQAIDLYRNYAEFLPLYVYNVLDTMPQDTAAVTGMLKQFASNNEFKEVNGKVLTEFSDVSDIEKDISEAYTYIHHYFPKIALPEIYFFVSGFNRSVLMTDSLIGVGTDFYLGADYEPYKSFTYDYLLYNMRRESLAIDVVSAVLFRHFTFDGKEDGLIDEMLHRGKIIYLLSVFMPEKKMADIIGYTPEQWKWAENYEKDIWAAIIGKKYLFSTDLQLIRKFMNDAPFTAPISQDSPGRLGTWMGWRIIDSYMRENKNITLEQLMTENNYRKILEQSHYRP